MSPSRERESAAGAPHPPLEKYYPGEAQRRAFVTALFDRTARHYDGITRLMSLGSGSWYRRDALRRMGLARGNVHLLDVAVGTGQVARAARDILGETGRVTGVDLSMGMLSEARRHLACALVQGVAEKLPFADACADFVTMGYALRHVTDLASTFREYLRVLKPGGTLLILEMTRPPADTAAYRIMRFYLESVVPRMARLGPGGAETRTLMEYCWDTVNECVAPATIIETLAESGFSAPRRNVVLHVFSEYVATKPRD
ncbi:MAG: class I SAM-dependent methyltransferase [Gammaproteobacteria bacterium]|nr:class I SAM-dependent methyltransferase [Gammaproteobacteria bacterium]NIM73084.1 class I SAM-dependent methyltransferase [Gammaproteobacteria bacterium]NIN38701.1 class I SAM-dependent methyltransferase [Gammaproteobacteria bacterium]NIO24837.1 class I SAM-dependent methyltransferase [Gammaproteobacteria bacterium]NIO65440.1 class I SAM-dependent methyltransferase [Gammaproteobacteria bacterium]